jgi:hypothetical protein
MFLVSECFRFLSLCLSFRLGTAPLVIDESEYASRRCVGSSIPFEMCDRELFTMWTSKSTVTQADMRLQLAAGEPTNSTSFLFTELWPLVESPVSTCLFALCNNQFPLLNVAELVSGFEGYIANRTATTANGMMLIVTRENTQQVWQAYKASWKVWSNV